MFDKEFKTAIENLPSTEKDKLIFRLLKKDLDLVNRLYFELVDTESRRNAYEQQHKISVSDRKIDEPRDHGLPLIAGAFLKLRFDKEGVFARYRLAVAQTRQDRNAAAAADSDCHGPNDESAPCAHKDDIMPTHRLDCFFGQHQG